MFSDAAILAELRRNLQCLIVIKCYLRDAERVRVVATTNTFLCGELFISSFVESSLGISDLLVFHGANFVDVELLRDSNYDFVLLAEVYHR